MNPKIALCTIALNEMEWLPRMYEQHKDWPGLVKWVFVEGADAEYAKSNPDRVSEFGLSVDGTPGFLRDLAKRDDRVQYIPHGLATHRDPAQGKCVLRNHYLRALDEVKPDFIIVVDADEFYPHEMQARINAVMALQNTWGWCFKHRDIWYPPSLQEGKMSPNPDEYQTAHDWFNSQRAVPPCKCDHCRNERVRRFRVKESFSQEVVGGFWDIPYARCWRWFEGLEYADNHNTPSRPNRMGPLDRRLARYDHDSTAPYFVHMAFASRLVDRAAKHRYYENRGEKVDRKRQWYTQSRAAYEIWQPGDELPHGAKVVPYTGIIPEVFR